MSVGSLLYFLEEAGHIACSKGWLECTHLIDDTSERPNVGLGVVGLISPDLRRGIVLILIIKLATRCACLCVNESALGDFGDIEIAEFEERVLDEDVGAFYVAMEDLPVVENLEPLRHLGNCPPDFLFSEVETIFDFVLDCFVEVALFCVLHDYAECVGFLL
jgi:hypothetical protein